MDRRCAGALLALAACIASTAAAPTASNQTALDLYDGAQQGCYYNFQHYGEGDRIMTNEPCLNCTCHNRMLMCYLRVCPFTKPIGQDCSVEKRADQCCPIVTCPDVPVDLLTSTSTTSPAEYGETGLGKLDRYGCSINGKYFPEGAKVPPTPSKPCEHCYCIRNMTTCVMQECTLHVDGCTPIYHKDVCCPVRYSCDHPEDEIPLLDDMTTTVRPTPGFLLTTTTLSPVTQMTQDCVHDDKVFADGALIKTEKACEHCYCMKGDIVCVVQECGTPMENEGKNCTSMPPREGQCCPDTYICEGDELTSETKSDFITESSLDEISTLSPPRRVIVEGSGYRKEPGEPFTEEPTFGPDTEGSGDDSFKPIGEEEVIIPESETTRPLITTENDDNIDQYSPSTSSLPVVDSEIVDMTTTEPDKSENTVPSGGIDDNVPEMPISDKTTPEESNLVTESGLTTESYLAAKTTVIQEDESSIKDKIATESEAEPTKPASSFEPTTADYQSPTSSDDKATAEPTEVTESTPNKQGDEKTPTEITTLKDKEDEVTTKATDYVAADAQTTESTPSPVEQEVKTTASQLPEEENEVVVKEPTTESYLESSTKSDIIKTETEPAATIGMEVTTSREEHIIETTSVNPVDNEIDEELYTTLSPGRIPGEGDCLLDGVTYSNESIVPSSNNCHTSCRCISSIVKCDPIICSAPPDYMDNCQPMYDPPESCCPTYVCDHTRETVPPKSHSQMAGTESPIPTPSVECNGDQCEIIKDKEEPTDSTKKPDECGTEGCQATDKKPEHGSHPSVEECVGEKCISPQVHCADGKCESPITPDQICDSENGCKIPVVQACQGEDCKTQPEVSAGEGSSAQCDSVNGCKDSQIPSSQAHCADGKCESPPSTNQICDSEHGCQLPVEQPCQGEHCKSLPEVIPAKDSLAPCDNADNCKEGQVPEGAPNCAGESCTSEISQKDTEDCKDGSDCTRPEQSPAVEECKEDECRRKDVLESTKPATGECTGSNCVSQDNLPQVTDAPELTTEAVKTTELVGSDEKIPNEPVTDNLPKTPDVEKETEASIFVKEENQSTTTHYDETDKEKEGESIPSVTDVPEIKTQAPEVQEYTTEITIQKETTVTSLENTRVPYEESSTTAPKLSDNETDDKYAELPVVIESESPESAPKPTEQSLVDDHLTEVPQEDIISDLTTATPSIHAIYDMATQITEDTTDKSIPDIITEEPKHDQDEIQTESPTTASSRDEVKETDNIHEDLEPNVTESAGSTTSASEESSTEKLDKEPIEHEHHDAFTTPKSYGGETNPPVSFETPRDDVSEEHHDTQTATPEKLSTLSQEDQEETELPGPIVTSKPITSKPDDMVSVTEGMLAPDDESETKSSVLPEISPSDTRVPESTTIAQEELHTMIPSPDTSDEIAVTPFEISDKNKVPTEAPMSIIKDKVEDETKPTLASESPEILPTEIPELTIHEHIESILTTEKSEQFDMKEDIATKAPDMSVTEPYYISTQEEAEEVPNLQDSKTNAPDVSVIEPQTETTEVPEQKLVTLDHRLTEPSEYEPKDVTTAIPEPTATELHKETTDAPEVHDVSTEGPEIHAAEPDKVTTEGPTLQDDTTSDSRISVTEPADKVTETPEIQEMTTNIPDTFVTETQKYITKLPDSQATTIPDVSEEKPNKESTNAYSSLDITTNTPEVSEPNFDKESSESPSSQDTTTKVPEITDAGVTEAQKEAPEAEPHESVTTVPETYIQKDVTEIPESQDIATSAPKISVTDAQEQASEAPDSQDTATNIPEMFTTAQKGQTEISDDSATQTPEISITESQKETTEASVTPDVAEDISESSETELQSEVTPGPAAHDATTNILETPISETHKYKTEAPLTENVVTEIPEKLTTESQKEVTDASVGQDVATSVPDISSTESQKEVTDAPEEQDVATSVPETSVTESQKEVTETPIAQDIATSAPETSATESQKEVTDALEEQDVATSVPETSVTESQKEVTETPIAQDVATRAPETFATESQKEITETPVAQDAVTSAPEISATGSQMEITETPVAQDIATSAPETSAIESQKEVTEAPVAQDIATSVPEISATESQKEVTDALEGQNVATSVPEISATESQKEVTETPMAQDIATSAPETSATESQKEVTDAPEEQDVATSVPEISVTESQKEVTETPIAQDVATRAPETFATESQKEITETPVAQDAVTSAQEISATGSQMEITETPVAQDIATSAPETSAIESQKEVTEAPVAQDIATSVPEISSTEYQKGVTDAPEEEDIATGAPETSGTESEKDVTETPVAQDAATSAPETSATESQQEVTETPVSLDISTSAPETSATEFIREVTESPVAQNISTIIPEISSTEYQKEVIDALEEQDVATSVPETSATESQKEVTETPMAQDVATSAPETSATESQKEVTDAPEEQDVATSVPKTSVTESQKEVTEASVAQDIATSVPEISATESQKEVTDALEEQDVATSVPETSATESQKEVTETPMAQDVATSAPESSATESQKEVTEIPVAQDVATSVPEISSTEYQKGLTDAPKEQDIATSAPETPGTESEKDVTETPVAQTAATSAPKTSATESQKEVTETPVPQDVATSAPETSATEYQKEVTDTPVPQNVATSAPETSATEYQKEVTDTPVPQDVATSAPEISATESQKKVTEAPVTQDVVEDKVTETAVPEIAGTESPNYDTSLTPEGELLHEQSTKVPESLVTGTQDKTTYSDIATDKPITSLQDSHDDKPIDDEKTNTEMPIMESAKPDEHIEPEKSDASTELPITSDSVEPDIKSPQPSDSDSDITKETESPVTEHEPMEKEEDTVSKSPGQSESQDQTTKTSEEPEQTSEYPETTPYLVLLEEHTHKKDIYTMSPDGEITTGASDVPSDYEQTTQASIDTVTTEFAPITEVELPIEKDEPAPATEETISEKVTEPSLLSEEKTTISPSRVTEEVQLTEKPQDLETNEISSAAPGEEQKESDKPSTSIQDEADKLTPSATEKPHETTAPEEEFILATTKATTIKTEEDFTSPPVVDKFGKPDVVSKPVSETETQKPDIADELPKPGVNEVQTTEEAPLPDSESQFPPSGASGYGQEPDYGEEDQAFGPGTCRYGGKVYVSAQQIPRDDPCDFCFCFRSDIICLQQSCPPPIHGCHEEPIQGFCCPRYECPVSMATTLNVTTTTTTTTTTLPPHFLPHAYKGAAQRRGCQIKGHIYKVGEVVRASSGPCLHCTCGGDGQMKCDPKVCTPEPMLRQMIAAAVSAKRRR